MDGMSEVFRFLHAVALVYLVLVTLRIILTWFRGADHHAPTEFLGMITDPWLRWFRRLGFLRVGPLDFSPAVGILALIVAADVLQRMAAAEQVTFGIILAQVLRVVWSAASLLMLAFTIMAVARAFLAFMRWEQGGVLLQVLDNTLQPLVTFVSRRIPLGARLMALGHTFQKIVYLGLIVALLLVAHTVVGVTIRWLVAQLATSPF